MNFKRKSSIGSNLKDFDSDVDTACDARDAHGRKVRVKLKLLDLKELSLA